VSATNRYRGSPLTARRLREVLRYNKRTGLFVWRIPRRVITVGRRAGAGMRGEWRIRIDGMAYPAHHLAQLYVHGVWPKGCVLAKNGDYHDCRWGNLQVKTMAQLQQSKTKPYRTNTTGYRGVSLYKGRYLVNIRANGKSFHVGSFSTAAEGGAAYREAKKRLHRA
jgi:hypothetical protein